MCANQRKMGNIAYMRQACLISRVVAWVETSVEEQPDVNRCRVAGPCLMLAC